MRGAALRALVVLAAVSTAAALTVPPPPSTYLSDWANVLDSEAEREVEARLVAIDTRTGHQVVVALFPALEDEALEDFTVRCAERWKAGRRGIDDGVIFFVFVNDRRMRLEIGYGLEDRIPDAMAARLLDLAKPGFRLGDYGAGVLSVVSGLEAIFRGDPLPEQRQRPGSRTRFLDVLLFLAAFFVLPFLLGRRRRGSSRLGGPGLWGGGFGGGFGGGGGGFGGFSGGGGGFGGGGASGGW